MTDERGLVLPNASTPVYWVTSSPRLGTAVRESNADVEIIIDGQTVSQLSQKDLALRKNVN